jgi:hypothetical protein
MSQQSKRNICRACGKACVGREYCRSCYTSPGKKKNTTSKKKEYSVYCLYTEVEGVFYVGCGQSPSRLHTTIEECRQKYRVNCMKCRYISACTARRITIHTWVACTCQTKQSAEEIEYALIQMYPSVLTNDALNWHPLKHLPAFLQGVQEKPGEKAHTGKQERRGDARRNLLAEGVEVTQVDSRPERIQRAVDAIIAFNNAAEQRLRWYINENVVCDLLGGLSSHDMRYRVRRYLAHHHEELEAHHRRYGLKESDNCKVLPVHERVKIEPPVAYEPYAERFRRIVDTILAYNDTVSESSLRWYINATVVRELAGGWSSGLHGHLAAHYLAGRSAELEAHHRKYGLTESDNRKPRGFWGFIYITERVKVEAELSREPFTKRIRRAVDAIMAYNEAALEQGQRLYISMPVVYDLLGGSSSGMQRYQIERYLAQRRDELNAYHHKHGITRQQGRKVLLCITECVKMDSLLPM